jgi:ATP/maltotriose-dependent transcriptional regulator MalT
VQTTVARLPARELSRSLGTQHVTLLVAPEGYGKSRLLADYALRRASAYVAITEDMSFARFASEIVKALSAHVPEMLQTLAGAYERALQARQPAAALATWFVRHLKDVRAAILVDDLHQASDPRIAHFILAAAENSPADCRWVIASEHSHDVPLAAWLAHGVAALPFDKQALMLTPVEAREIAAALRPGTDAEEVERLRRFADGVVGDFVMLLRRPRVVALEETGRAERFEPMFDEIYRSLGWADRAAALEGALVAGLDGAPLAELRERFPHVFEIDSTDYIPRFRRFLLAKLASSGDRTAFSLRAAQTLEDSGNVADALKLTIAAGKERAILGIIERHGFASLESEHAHLLHDALAALSEEARATNPAILALLGMSAALGGHTDVSEAYFQNALKACNSPWERTQIRYWYGCELLRRGRPDALSVLEPDADYDEIPAPLRTKIMSARAAGTALENRFDEAHEWLDRAMLSLESVEDDAVRARVYHQTAFVALREGKFERAKEFAEAASTLAARIGAHEVASGALSVLYNVAIDVDEDCARATEYLRQIAVYGAKCGSVEKQVYALVAAYEIEVERGDVASVAQIERDLSEFEVQYSARCATQALLPAQVLQIACQGDFARAHRILASSAGQHQESERRALRWAEIAVHATAAGATAEALRALAAMRKLDRFPKATNVFLWRARILSALAEVMLGQLGAAKAILKRVERDVPQHRRRLRALAGAVDALADWRAGEADHVELFGALERLRRDDFGGYARMLEMLPPACVEPLAVGAGNSA